MKKLLICLSVLGTLSAMETDTDPKYKGKPSFTHFYVQDTCATQTKGIFTVSYTDKVVTILKDKQLTAKIRAQEPQRIKRSFPSTDAHDCPNREILIIDIH